MNICTVCKQKFEDKYFINEEKNCILHCDKNHTFKNVKEFNTILTSYIVDILIKMYSQYKKKYNLLESNYTKSEIINFIESNNDDNIMN